MSKLLERVKDNSGYIEAQTIITIAVAALSLVILCFIFFIESKPDSLLSIGNAVFDEYGDRPDREDVALMRNGQKVIVTVDGEDKLVEYTGLRDGEPQFELTDLPE